MISLIHVAHDFEGPVKLVNFRILSSVWRHKQATMIKFMAYMATWLGAVLSHAVAHRYVTLARLMRAEIFLPVSPTDSLQSSPLCDA